MISNELLEQVGPSLEVGANVLLRTYRVIQNMTEISGVVSVLYLVNRLSFKQDAARTYAAVKMLAELEAVEIVADSDEHGLEAMIVRIKPL